MARHGLSKQEIQKVRDTLIAQGQHPTVDAVRIALGNTGSKTTIHKYLKELEYVEPKDEVQQISISETIENLIHQLATQLQSEATIEVEKMRQIFDEQEHKYKNSIIELQHKIEILTSELSVSQANFDQESKTHQETKTALQEKQLENALLIQQVLGLKEEVNTHQHFQKSLEEKHQHAQNALEHYRESVKVQREQELRKHDQQLQHLQADINILRQNLVVKQEEVTALKIKQQASDTAIELAQKQYAELTHIHQTLSEQHHQTDKAWSLSQQYVTQQQQTIQALKEKLETSIEQKEEFKKQYIEVQIALSAKNAELQAQSKLIESLNVLIQTIDQSRLQTPPDH